MDRTEELEKIKTIISYLKQKEYDECLQNIDELQHQIEAEIENGIIEWHKEKIIGLKAIALQESGNREKALEIYKEIGEDRYKKARYYCESAGCNLAFAALICFKLEKEEEACKLAEKAIHLSGLVKSISSPIREVAEKLEKVKNRKAKEAYKKDNFA